MVKMIIEKVLVSGIFDFDESKISERASQHVPIDVMPVIKFMELRPRRGDNILRKITSYMLLGGPGKSSSTVRQVGKLNCTYCDEGSLRNHNKIRLPLTLLDIKSGTVWNGSHGGVSQGPSFMGS